MTDAVSRDLANHLAAIDKEDSRQAAVDALATEYQEAIDIVIEGQAYGGKESWRNGRQFLSRAIEDDARYESLLSDLLIDLSNGAAVDYTITKLRNEIRAKAYELATAKAEEVIDEPEEH